MLLSIRHCLRASERPAVPLATQLARGPALCWTVRQRSVFYD